MSECVYAYNLSRAVEGIEYRFLFTSLDDHVAAQKYIFKMACTTFHIDISFAVFCIFCLVRQYFGMLLLFLHNIHSLPRILYLLK